MGRWFRFFIVIGLGAVMGMLYGWLISPVQYVDTAPDSLRIDYRTDAVLMAAEAYKTEQDLSLAVRRLALLGSQPPQEIVQQAIAFGVEFKYAASDLALMQALHDGLRSWNPSQEVPIP